MHGSGFPRVDREALWVVRLRGRLPRLVLAAGVESLPKTSFMTLAVEHPASPRATAAMPSKREACIRCFPERTIRN